MYYVGTLGLFLTYGWILHACRRAPVSTVMLCVLLGTPLVFQLFWLFTRPVLSIDLYSYLVDSHSASIGLNPYLHAPRDLGHLPFGIELTRLGWRPTHGPAPYGPLWISIMAALGRTGASLPAEIIASKSIILVANSGCAIVVYLILKEMRPALALVGATAYWWNPATLTEAAAEGHNDALMALAVLLGIWSLIRQRPMLGALGWTAGVLTKYVPAVLAPAFVTFLWRTSTNRRAKVFTLIAMAGLCLITTAVMFAPFWAGFRTLQGLREGAQLKFTNGSSGALFWLLGELGIGTAAAAHLTRLVLGGALFTVLVIASRSVRDRQTFVIACATISLSYVLLASPRFWPWYVTLPAALLCASGRMRDIVLAYVLTLCARLVAPLDVIRLGDAISWPVEVWATTIVAVWIPAAFWIWQSSLATRRVTSVE